ncbi:MAG: NUDIX hydrolase [Planctomycetota bacterium]
MSSIERLGEGRFLRFLREGRWEWVERVNSTGVVAIVALTDANEIVLVEQERHAVGKRLLEIPAGLVGDHDGDDSLEDAAARELMEETGFAATGFELVSEFPSSAGLTSETIHFFRARGVHRVAEGGGIDDEEIEVHLVPLGSAWEWVRERERTGVMLDMKLLAGLYLAGVTA